jgi:C4-dicarboxylate-specific signal transduction histidine kinase
VCLILSPLCPSRVRETGGSGIVSFETTLPAASGESRAWRIILVPLQPAEGVVTAILLGSDITEMRQAEARLLRAERLAALGNLSALARTYLRSVREALDRSVDITTRLMPLSVSPDAEEAPVLVGEAVRQALARLPPALAEEGVILDASLEDSMPVRINRQQLDFIINALLANARHAVLDQPVRRILVKTGTVDGQSSLCVRDTGIGIAREKQSSLFTPFFCEKGEHAPPDSPQAKVHGVGLSLAESHSIVTGKGGRIEVESTPGARSAFTVWLPARGAEG